MVEYYCLLLSRSPLRYPPNIILYEYWEVNIGNLIYFMVNFVETLLLAGFYPK